MDQSVPTINDGAASHRKDALKDSRELPEGWDNFYVILESAAAGLIGLTFVVIAL